MINLVRDLDTLEGSKKINLDDLDKSKTYSIRVDFHDIGSSIKPEASLQEVKKILKRKEYQGAKFYIKEGSYFN